MACQKRKVPQVYLQVSAWCYTVGFKLCIVVTHTVGRIHHCFSWLWPVFRGNKFKHFWNGQNLCWLFLQGYGGDILWTLHLNTTLQAACQFWWLWLHFKVTVASWVETELFYLKSSYPVRFKLSIIVIWHEYNAFRFMAYILFHVGICWDAF